MIIYHPALDLNHGMFRLLSLLDNNPQHELRWDQYRILDFYYLFPHLLMNARLPPALTARKRTLAKFGSKYTHVPSPRTFIEQLTGIHEAVARSLVAKEVLDPAAKTGVILLHPTLLCTRA